MIWFLFALLHVFATSFANILRKVLMREDDVDPIASAIIFQLLTALLFLIISLIHGFVMPPVLQYFWNFLFSACCYALGTLCIFKAFKYLEASEATIIASFDTIVTITSAVLFLGDHFNFQKVIGSALIFIPVVLITYQKKMVLNRGVFYALGMALFYGLAVTNDAFLLKVSEPLSFLFIGFLLPGILLFLFRPKAILDRSSLPNKKNFITMLYYIIAYSVAAIGFYYALALGGHASQVAPIAQSSIVLTVLLSAYFLNERKHLMKKIILACAVVIGVTLLT